MPVDSSAMLRDIARDGLGAASAPQRVVVVGAGMAGLVAATELRRAGHQVTVLEGRERVGGRIYTMREPFTHGLRAEAGAMRIPKTHDLTLHYVDRYGLQTTPFTMNNPQAYLYLGGTRMRAHELASQPYTLGFDLEEHERMTPIGQLWEQTVASVVGHVAAEGEAAWEAISREHDQFSLREFLEAKGWSEGAIELYGMAFHMESMMSTGVIEILREEAGRWFEDLCSIEGGMDRLPNAFLAELGGSIRFGARMTALAQGTEGVVVYYQTAAGRFAVEADRAIVTVPFPVLRHVEVLQPFSRGKQRAIRQLHYDASAKVFLQSRRRFWEEDDGIFGGGTVTDLPIRALYYPDHGRETGRGVLLASYTWAEDAQRWGSLSPGDRIVQAIENVSQIHPQIREEFEVGASKMWHDDEFAGGAFALFEPGQQTSLYQHIVAPEGRFHFAGEHASLGHAWIQGAIESGLRAALEVHAAR
ncbi:MAG: amine oxidase [Anaerolinea sp.]|nr:amine oxidase [Anaerolinea sp.]